MRQAVHDRIEAGGGERLASPSDDCVRPNVAWQIAAITRIAALPFAALTAALAGLLFVVLLPVCGIASIAEAMARTSWAFVRSGRRRPNHTHLHTF